MTNETEGSQPTSEAGTAASLPDDRETAALGQRGDLIALIGTTTRLYADCLLPNGALLEAPSHLPFYPATARDAFRCRPGLLITNAIKAMDALGRDARTPVLRWLRDRAAGFRDDGLLRTTYLVHGPPAEKRPDPIGTGALLAAIFARPDRAPSSVTAEVGRSLATAIAVRWDGHRFRELPTTDGAVRAAELTITEAGLRLAATALDVGQWTRVADNLAESRDRAITACLDRPARINMERRDEDVAAYLTLASATTTGTHSARLADLAEQAIGLHEIDGHTHDPDAPIVHHPGAGLRPAELFWLAAALARVGQLGRADRYHALALALADPDGHFPERTTGPDRDPAPKPFLLAHLTMILAADALGHLAALPRSGYAGRPERTR